MEISEGGKKNTIIVDGAVLVVEYNWYRDLRPKGTSQKGKKEKGSPLVCVCVLKDGDGKEIALGTAVCSILPWFTSSGHKRYDNPDRKEGRKRALERAIRAYQNKTTSEHMVTKARHTLFACGIISHPQIRRTKKLPKELKYMSVFLDEAA